VVDPENSAFFPAYRDGAEVPGTGLSSRIEGIGRPRVEPSFISQVIDRMMSVPDAASISTARRASDVLGWRVGGSTGTNLWGALRLVAEMREQKQAGSVVTLLCDGGDRYSGTYYDDEWLAANGLDLNGAEEILDEFFTSGQWSE
jgi:cysteine synthase A